MESQKRCKNEGPSVAITFQNERLEERAGNFAAEDCPRPLFLKCDVDEDHRYSKYLFEQGEPKVGGS